MLAYPAAIIALVSLVDPIPGKIFDQDGGNAGFLSDKDPHWRNIANNQRRFNPDNMFCQASDH